MTQTHVLRLIRILPVILALVTYCAAVGAQTDLKISEATFENSDRATLSVISPRQLYSGPESDSEFIGAAATPISLGSVGLFTACVNGLQVDINGVASPGASVTNISWVWGDGQQTIGFFPQSHVYSAPGQYNILVTAHYNNGSSASAPQAVRVSSGVLANCLALTISAGQYGSVSYQASVGSGTVPAGSLVTLQLDFADDLLLAANPNAGFSFSSWSPSAGITGTGAGAVNTTSSSIDIVVVGNSSIGANFILSIPTPPTPTSTPPLSNFPPVPQLFTSRAASFSTLFENQTSSNAQSWFTTSSIQTNVSAATNFLSLNLPPGVKQGMGIISKDANALSTGLGLAGSAIDPLNLRGDLLTAAGLALQGGTAALSLQNCQSPLPLLVLTAGLQLALDGASVALSCATAAAGTVIGPLNAPFVVGCALAVGSTVADVTSDVAFGLQCDPPDPNYKEVFVPQPIVTAPVALSGIPQNLATATWASLNALDQATMWLNAVRVTANRYGTALANNDAASAGMQYMAFLNYFGLYLQAAGTASQDLTELAAVLQSAGIGTQAVTSEQIQAGLTFLETQGTSSPFITQFLSSLGFTPVQIQTMIDQVEANPPSPPTATPVQALRTLAGGFAKPGVHLTTRLKSLTLNTSNDEYVAVLSVTNLGTTTAGKVTIAEAELRDTPSSSALPANLGNLGYAGFGAATLTFPISAGEPGSHVELEINEEFNGASLKLVKHVRLPGKGESEEDNQ